jgi:hypothetical protein
MSFDLEGYTTVQERLTMFYQLFPTGSIQFEFMGVLPGNPQMMWGMAKAYRTPEDTRPGIGTAAELFEGKTPYSKGSEIQNLETSCWGRAVGSLGIGLSKGIASKQEVQAAKDRQAPGPKITPPIESDPWALEPQPNGAIAPECQHGQMTRKTGLKKMASLMLAGFVAWAVMVTSVMQFGIARDM